MNEHTDIAASRPLGVAAALGALISEADILAKPVILTGERSALKTKNGRWCLTNSLRLLSRIVGSLTIVLPMGMTDFERQVRELAAQVWTRRTVTVVLEGDPVDFQGASAVLNVGSSANRHATCTTINSNGWVARVCSTDVALPPDMDLGNPLGAMLAASFGVTEVFKRVYEVPAERAPLLGLTEFSLFDLSASLSGLGPPLPDDIELPDTAMVGAGAIGNGIALLLSQLPVRGRLHIIDKQAFGRENFGTCVMLDLVGWLGESKAEVLAAWLKATTGLDATGEMSFVADASSGEHLSGMAVDLVLNGLDDAQARHDAQLLWPSVLVDGGINALGVGVVTHRLDRPEGACLRCTFSLPTVDARAAQAAATGLDATSFDAGLDRPLTASDIELADESRRDWLRERMKEGKTLCATITEAHRSLGVGFEDGFEPSVPFVATAAAALVVAQALKALFHPNAELPQRFQMESFFVGPDSSAGVLTRSNPSCLCVSRRALIGTMAEARCAQRLGS